MAIIEVCPGSPTAIQDAIDAANEGDVVLVHRGIYHESVRLQGAKNNVRIVARHKHGAVLDGRLALREAFALESVAGAEISGFAIRNYYAGGIRIDGGKSHRVLDNAIRDMSGVRGDIKPFGIYVNRSEGNLLMRNKIERIGGLEPGNAIQLDGATGNWVVRNRLLNNARSGIEIAIGLHHGTVGNRIAGNASDGVTISGSDNHLFLDNMLERNGGNGLFGRSTNNFVVGGTVQHNGANGLLFTFDYNLALDNEIRNNRQSGAAVRSNFNDIQGNRVEKNENDGLFIEAPHTANFAFGNRFKRNRPRDILDEGTDNNFVNNDRV